MAVAPGRIFLKRARCTAFLRLPLWPSCPGCPPKDQVRRAASRCSSPAWSTCSGRRSASPRSSCSRTPAARSRCRPCRSAAASRPTIPAIAPRRGPSRAQVIEAFEGYDAVVAPSGSCGGMLAPSLSRPVRRRSGDEGAGRGPGRPQLRADGVPGRRAGRAARSRRATTAPSPITIPARACASSASRTSRASCSASVDGPQPARDEDARGLLRLRRHLLREISRDLQCHGRREVGRYRGHRRRHAAGGRSRLPDEHGGQAAARGQRRCRCAMSPKCWPAWAASPPIGEPEREPGTG